MFESDTITASPAHSQTMTFEPDTITVSPLHDETPATTSKALPHLNSEQQWEVAKGSFRNRLIKDISDLTDLIPGVHVASMLRDYQIPEPPAHPRHLKELQYKENYDAMQDTISTVEFARLFLPEEEIAQEGLAAFDKISKSGSPLEAQASIAFGKKLSNMLKNMRQKRAATLGSLPDWHHLLPKEFQPFFEGMDINIHKWAVWLSKAQHKLVHDLG